jgi:hypothetical protein
VEVKGKQKCNTRRKEDIIPWGSGDGKDNNDILSFRNIPEVFFPQSVKHPGVAFNLFENARK